MDELVKSLRICADGENCDQCAKWDIKQNGGRNACEYAICTEAADAIEELAGFVQEAERDRDEYRERLDKANDAIEELQKCLDGVEADNDSLCATIEELERDLKRSKEYEAFWEKEAKEALKKFQTTHHSRVLRWIMEILV